MGQLLGTKTRVLFWFFVLINYTSMRIFCISTLKWKQQLGSLRGARYFHITWYWTVGLRQVFRRNEFPSRLYQRWLVGDAWGNWRLMIGGRVADFVRCFAVDWLWSNRNCADWSNDFERFVSRGLIRIDAGALSTWSVFMMAPLSEDLPLFSFGGFIEILADGGDESNSENRRNIFVFLI